MIVAALAVYITASPGHRASPARRRPAAGSAAGSAAAPAALASHPLRLVAGSHLVNGIYTGYPHSLAGAVSAAVEFVTELGSTLEPDQAATIARLTAAPSYAAAAQDAATSTIDVRHQLGLPADGPVPPGTAVLVVPAMYQLREVSADQVTVLLLFDYTQTLATGIREHAGVTAVRLGWTPASWRLLPPAAGGPDPSDLIATPGTAAAAAKGWETMTNGL